MIKCTLYILFGHIVTRCVNNCFINMYFYCNSW